MSGLKSIQLDIGRLPQIHVHCFTDSPELAGRLLEHFPNLYIGITGKCQYRYRSVMSVLILCEGVITYRTNLNTANVIKNMMTGANSLDDIALRILLETDAPYMVPSNIYPAIASLGTASRGKLPLSHASMIPWTAAFVAETANTACSDGGGSGIENVKWDVPRVLRVARENARRVYGI
jgi:TatD DNase family protein